MFDVITTASKNVLASSFGVGTTTEEDAIAEAKEERNSRWGYFLEAEQDIQEQAAANAEEFYDDEECDDENMSCDFDDENWGDV